MPVSGLLQVLQVSALNGLIVWALPELVKRRLDSLLTAGAGGGIPDRLTGCGKKVKLAVEDWVRGDCIFLTILTLPIIYFPTDCRFELLLTKPLIIEVNLHIRLVEASWICRCWRLP